MSVFPPFGGGVLTVPLLIGILCAMKWFRRKTTPDSDQIIQETWNADFRKSRDQRFPEFRGEGYAGEYFSAGFRLSLYRNNLFAWINSSQYRYSDFVLEAMIDTSPDNGYASAGFLLRYMDDANFYYCLVSSQGFFRFDSVFNSTPTPLIDWTPLPVQPGERFKLTLVARQSQFLICVDDEWCGEVEDDMFSSGGIAFAAQNYSECSEAVFTLASLSLLSRPPDVEKSWDRWRREYRGSVDQRIRIAQSFFDRGQFLPASIQLKRAFAERQPDVEQLFLLGLCYLNLNLLREALDVMETCLEIDSGFRDALHEKGNILYLENRFIETRAFLSEHLPRLDDRAAVHNLLGNAEYALGNWSASAQAYREAIALDGESPLLNVNLARALLKTGVEREAADQFVEACCKYFRLGEYTEAVRILPEIRAIIPDDPALLAIEAKIDFYDNRFVEAERGFDSLIAAETADSGVYYLKALLLMKQGTYEKALPLMEKALVMEPEFPLYVYKCAELYFQTNRDPTELLEQARKLNPEDPWVFNLYGLQALARNNVDAALEWFDGAHEALPGDVDILINYAEALTRAGRTPEALERLEAADDNPALLREYGRILCDMEEWERGAAAFRHGLELLPNDPELELDLASAWLKTGRFSPAEEILARLAETRPSAPVFNLLGNVALVKGEYARAEAAYDEALQRDASNREVMLNMAELLCVLGRFGEAENLLANVPSDACGERAARLGQRIAKALYRDIVCGLCGRKWRVPRELPPQPPLRLHGEPAADLPAGRCSECGRVFCIKCAEPYVRDQRFHCPDCGVRLTLNDEALKYLLLEAHATGKKPSAPER